MFCPTSTAVENLRQEGLTRGVHLVGDVMYDVALFWRERARERSSVLTRLRLESGRFILATCHLAENTDDPHRLQSIVRALGELAVNERVVLPLHPRTANSNIQPGSWIARSEQFSARSIRACGYSCTRGRTGCLAQRVPHGPAATDRAIEPDAGHLVNPALCLGSSMRLLCILKQHAPTSLSGQALNACEVPTCRRGRPPHTTSQTVHAIYGGKTMRGEAQEECTAPHQRVRRSKRRNILPNFSTPAARLSRS